MNSFVRCAFFGVCFCWVFLICKITVSLSLNGTVAMSSANGLVGNEFFLFKAQWVGRCKATTPSSLSLTSNRVTTNPNYCPRQTAQLITGVCGHDRRVL